MKTNYKLKKLFYVLFLFIGGVTTLKWTLEDASKNDRSPLAAVNVEVERTKEVIPCGTLIGIKVESQGICVLGTSPFTSIDGEVSPCKNKIEKGDAIYSVNGEEVYTKEDLREQIENYKDQEISLKIKRENEWLNIKVQPAYCESEESYKLGLWVKDSTQGIGTITYYDPDNQSFGALGHGITDVDLKKLFPVKEGELTKAHITSVKKGHKGVPGELKGVIEYTPKNIIGEIEINTPLGIYGHLNTKGVNFLESEKMPIGYQGDIHEGAATILTNIVDNQMGSYEVMIRKVAKYSSEPTKGMVIQITDPKLLETTNGIVQGMSGSPIIQDGKLIGAVTHVFIQDPTKGYGIFIENMLNNEVK